MPPSCCRRSWPWPGMLAIKTGAASLFLPIIEPGSTKATDKYTVVFTLNEPSAIFLATVPEILVVNSKLVKKNEKDGDWASVACEERGQRRLLQAEALRSGDRLRGRAVQGAFRRLGRRGVRRDRIPCRAG